MSRSLLRRVVLTAIAGAAVLGVSACAKSVPVLSGTAPDPTRRIDELYDRGVAGHDLLLVVAGAPFAVPEGDFAEAVEHAARVTPPGRQPVQAALHPGVSAYGGYKLVLVFNPPKVLSGEALCAEHVPAGGGPATVVRVSGAFCIGGTAYTQVDGEVAATGPADKAFRNLVQQVVVALFRLDVPITPGSGRS